MAYALFLSTPSARRATYDDDHVPTQDTISIHALREEGDCHTDNCCLVDAISIHALREEGDCTAFSTNSSSRLFLSTPSARRATRHCPMWTLLRVFLSTPSARRATRSSEVIDDVSVISIHALREEGDTRRHQNDSDRHGFLSTPSARRATKAARLTSRATRISIHALREEGDPGPFRWPFSTPGISIHALREEGDTSLLCWETRAA